MKDFLPIELDPVKARVELMEFDRLLRSKSDLDENTDIKPFFEARHNLSALIGGVGSMLPDCDRIAFQYQLFGDFSCDLVIGDSTWFSFGFVEWEEARPQSLFRKQGQKATPEWSKTLNEAHSQIIDWLWKLDDMTATEDFRSRFGNSSIQAFGLIVIGRDESLKHPREEKRWRWRSTNTECGGSSIFCLTYDQLYRFLKSRFTLYDRSEQNEQDQPDD